MQKKERKTLSQVFSKLMARLLALELYNEVIYDGEVPVFSYSIKEIETVIFDYPPKEAIKRVDICLDKIQKLQKQGETIIGAVTVEDYHEELGEYVLASDERTKEAKKDLFESIRVELLFYDAKLSNLKESLQLNCTLEATTQKTKTKQYISIPPDELSLDMRQFALLFDYLRDLKVIQPLPKDRLASYMSLLTGFESKIRTTKGLGAIPKIKSDEVVSKGKKGKTQHYNLKSVKQVLQKVIDQIDGDIIIEDKKRK